MRSCVHQCRSFVCCRKMDRRRKRGRMRREGRLKEKHKRRKQFETRQNRMGRERETVSSSTERDKVSLVCTGGSGIQNNQNGTGPLSKQSQEINFQPEKISNPHTLHMTACIQRCSSRARLWRASPTPVERHTV